MAGDSSERKTVRVEYGEEYASHMSELTDLTVMKARASVISPMVNLNAITAAP